MVEHFKSKPVTSLLGSNVWSHGVLAIENGTDCHAKVNHFRLLPNQDMSICSCEIGSLIGDGPPISNFKLIVSNQDMSI